MFSRVYHLLSLGFHFIIVTLPPQTQLALVNTISWLLKEMQNLSLDGDSHLLQAMWLAKLTVRNPRRRWVMC